jgi:hypothetical protein
MSSLSDFLPSGQHFDKVVAATIAGVGICGDMRFLGRQDWNTSACLSLVLMGSAVLHKDKTAVPLLVL